MFKLAFNWSISILTVSSEAWLKYQIHNFLFCRLTCWVTLCYVIAITRFSEAWYRSNILSVLTCSTGQRFLQPGCHIVMLRYRNWIFQKPNQNTGKWCRKLGVFSKQSELQLQFKEFRLSFRKLPTLYWFWRAGSFARWFACGRIHRCVWTPSP